MSNPTYEPKFETRCLHSLVKVFADTELNESPFSRATVLHNETYAFQVAYRTNAAYKNIQVSAASDLSDSIMIRTVGLVPSEFPMYADHDGNLLRSTPGLYPDPLFPIDRDGVNALPNQWRSVWVSLDISQQIASGIHSIQIRFALENGDILGSETFELDVVPVSLPKQRLVHTEWFHTDCIATYYGVEVFSEEHWHRIEQFVQTAARHGMNMLLTPLFTPPLDTAVGGERPTVQLVDVEKDGGTYRFGFDRLKRWVDMATVAGIQYFEFSHLFTQWGAKNAPKIMAIENGECKRIFGWETDAHGEAYKSFLGQFLPALVDFIRANGLNERSYFHVSDEPNLDHLESYRSTSETIKGLLEGFPMIDALSDYDFYDKGLVEYPIPANNHIEPFLENNVPNLWTYYCCVQYRDVANRFFVFPSVRNRVLGLQLYKFQIAGFLHWGYNFWYSQYSKKAIDPFRVTDAGQGFPSGDAFLVYPGEQGPVESLRLEVFYEAIQDLRALELLESQIGRDAVLLLLEEGLEKPITFSDYPNDADWLLGKREQINRKIAESSSGVPYIRLGFTIPFIDLSTEKEKQVLTDREPGQYLGQPDSVLLNDGTIYTVYPKGHGIGPLILKKSSDGGLTWSERLSTAASWATSQETPTVYKIEKPDGKIRLELISGLVRDGNVGFQTAYSEDNGATWSELKPYFQDQGKAGIVALASLTRLKNPDDSWTYRWMGIFHDFSYNNWKTYLTFDANGNEQWSTPVRLLAEHDAIEKYAGLCEIEVIRSPDGKQLALLARAQFKKTNAMITFSNDEGNTWTEPKEMQGALMGERHKAEYDPVSGRLLITFREIIRRSATNLDDWVAGDWVAWVGTYDDLVHFREGQYRVRLMEDYTPSVRSGDTGYAGNVVLADGTYVLTSYGYFDSQDTRAPYIMTVRVKLSELDQRMNN